MPFRMPERAMLSLLQEKVTKRINIIGNEMFDFDDREIAIKAIRELVSKDNIKISNRETEREVDKNELF